MHWSAAPRRRRAFLDCIADGMPAGWGVDDGAALVFEGTELSGAVAARAGRARLADRARGRRGRGDARAHRASWAIPEPTTQLAKADAAIEELRELRRYHSARGHHGVRRVRLGI